MQTRSHFVPSPPTLQLSLLISLSDMMYECRIWTRPPTPLRDCLLRDRKRKINVARFSQVFSIASHMDLSSVRRRISFILLNVRTDPDVLINSLRCIAYMASIKAELQVANSKQSNISQSVRCTRTEPNNLASPIGPNERSFF